MSPTIEDRITGVINGLMPATDPEGRFRHASSLRERMAYHHTPGVSIAVINGPMHFLRQRCVIRSIPRKGMFAADRGMPEECFRNNTPW